MNYTLNTILLCVFLYYSQSQSSQMHHNSQILNHFFIRWYAVNSNPKIRKSYIKPVIKAITNTNENIKIFLINTSGEYTKISEEDRFFIETMLSLMF